MELVTQNLKDPNHRMPLWHNPREIFSPDLGAGTRLRLILVEGGTGILRLADRREVFAAPAVFCLNETDRPELEQSVGLRAQALYFHPNVVNSALTFENLRGPGDKLSLTEQQDRYWLKPFVQRDSGAGGYLCLGPVSAQRISSLLKAAGRTLASQDDWNWSCRSRSYLLELLFVLERVASAPQVAEEDFLPEFSGDADPIILYLHTHYQEKVTLAELARVFHTNRTTLTERFRQSTGVSVITYLIQLRVRLAALMLRDTSLSVAEIGERVGFNDNSHFTRTFRDTMECSPTEYRQRYCWHEPHYWLPRQQVGEPWRTIRQPAPL
jgi:AraC-like DNA-binding protein